MQCLSEKLRWKYFGSLSQLGAGGVGGTGGEGDGGDGVGAGGVGGEGVGAGGEGVGGEGVGGGSGPEKSKVVSAQLNSSPS